MQYMTGWEDEFKLNKSAYIKIMDETLNQKQETDISFLENSLSELHDRDFVIACASGTDALHISLLSYGIGLGDEVLVTDFSWLSSASCVAMVGAIPVFCDIDLESYHMSLDSIKRMVSDKTKAIVYPHLFGNMSDTTEIEEFCAENDIIFIEDSCQSIGSSYKGRIAGAIGDVSTLSFNANKNIAGIAGGGAIMTDDYEIAEFCRKAVVHGKGEFLGRNSKMLLFNARVIDYRLQSIWEYQTWRQKNAEVITAALGKHIPKLFRVQNDPNVDHNYHKYTVRFRNVIERNKMRNAIGAAVHYPDPISSFPMWKDIPHRKDDTVNARLLCDTIMTLPLHHYTDTQKVHDLANLFLRVVDDN